MYVEYTLFISEEKFKTEVCQGKSRSPPFNYKKEHTQACVTDNFLKYLKEECLVFKVYGYPDVKKKDDAKKKKPG